ncbi:uncharacterized protein SCHCODRAFT_02629162 [Schizophyllum commune H4-8]|uniref:uncharacterized protein n=1 Tax=Schizophyllum commune (strain H4-8 / FGSC 9210) TaxID=578458 RepID=UPI00215EC3ED|nr:uncharacterized protein SCHCODRAFT_02629162 [Schizophyllum commune H4-8]KAI5891458.1 hypothetical protein SCHCODRAFT_02629162 [Schizophyllum commune H4-8]
MSRDAEVSVKQENHNDDNVASDDREDAVEDLDFEDDGHNCSICLQELVDRTVIPTCSHEFCFECLLIWTEQSRKCPLCNQNTGDHLIHNIRSNYDYQRHYLNPLRTSPKPALAVRSTAAAPIRRRRAEREWGRRAARQAESDRLDESIRKRRWVYQHGLYAKHVASNSFTRYRPYPTPAQFAGSHDLIARTTAFLRRELQVWVNLDVEFLTTFIISIMKSIDIRAESAIKLLAEFLDMDSPYVEGNRHPNAEHFAHEVYSFVRSPYKDLFVYDRVVQYDADIAYTPEVRRRPSHYSPRSVSPIGEGSRRSPRSRSRSPRPPKRRTRSHSRSRYRPTARQRRRTSQRRYYSPELSWSPSGRCREVSPDEEHDRRSRAAFSPSPMRGVSPSGDDGDASEDKSTARRSTREHDVGANTHERGREGILSEKARGKLPLRGERHHHTRGHDVGISPNLGSAQTPAVGRNTVSEEREVPAVEENVLEAAPPREGVAEGTKASSTPFESISEEKGERRKKPPRPFSLRDSVHAHILGSRPARTELQRTHQPSVSSKQVFTQGGAAPSERPPALLARLSDPISTSFGPEKMVARSHRPALLERLSDRLTEGSTSSNKSPGKPDSAESHTPEGEHTAPPSTPSEQLRARRSPGHLRKQDGHAARAAPLVSPAPLDAEQEVDKGATGSQASSAADEGRARLLRRLMKERNAVHREPEPAAVDNAQSLAMEAELRSRAKVRMRLAALKGDV